MTQAHKIEDDPGAAASQKGQIGLQAAVGKMKKWQISASLCVDPINTSVLLCLFG
jgi:hypothetical protein